MLFRVMQNLMFVARTALRGRFVLREDRDHLEAAIAWLCKAQDVSRGGGVSGLYDLREGWYAAYPETSGYIIETFLAAGRILERSDLIDRAFALGDWEMTIQLPNGGVRGGLLRRGLGSDPVVFNTGQVMFGWHALSLHSGGERFLEASAKAARWLSECMDEDGTWRTNVYRGFCGTYHSRVAWAMLDYAVQAGASDVLERAVKHVEWVLAQQMTDGFFRNMGFDAGSAALTHTIAYTLEGLDGAAAVLEGIRPDLSQRCLASIRLASEGLMKTYEVSGVLWSDYNEGWTPGSRRSVCVTGVAQTARVLLRESIRSKDLRFANAGLKMLDFVKSVQSLDTHLADVKGAIPGSWPLWGKYQRFRFPNWAAKFFCDALMEKRTVMEKLGI